ncbi:extracellular serine/threonine protein kinase FAM20C-like [Scyliorhinus canicula]|uniref:extracellular serine/threonine protein kinase FAM20C-like n=1 Tax=Scyliorhinus canicula TaxID=7830 RepID=UPI0018F3DC20|nr:extracellular serine/threonine protein kinase FAM20C-like [Scyliorhinus canicula]
MNRRIPMLMFWKSKLMLLILILISLVLHVLIALVPVQERCDRRPQAGGQKVAASAHRPGKSSKTNRELQNYASARASSRTSQSLDSVADPNDKIRSSHRKQHSQSGLRPESKPPMELYKPNTSKLAALFQHPLYNVPIPALTPDDELFSVNSAEKFNPKSSNSDGWVSHEQEYVLPVGNSPVDSYPNWMKFFLGINRYELYSRNSTIVGSLLRDLSTGKFVRVVQKLGGTQLKLTITLQDYGKVLFKPMKQTRDEETSVDLFYFSDFERHNAEIAAFHLDRCKCSISFLPYFSRFGRHSRDEPSILVPLQQCCRIRRGTFLRLQLLATESYRFSDVMRESLQSDGLAPILSEPHLIALNRRLLTILETVKDCISRHGERKVLQGDLGAWPARH